MQKNQNKVLLSSSKLIIKDCLLLVKNFITCKWYLKIELKDYLISFLLLTWFVLMLSIDCTEVVGERLPRFESLIKPLCNILYLFMFKFICCMFLY